MELEEALAMTERFTQQYNSLLKRFEEEMFNTSSILDMFNRQFSWVSSLANNTKDGIFRVQAVRRSTCHVYIRSSSLRLCCLCGEDVGGHFLL